MLETAICERCNAIVRDDEIKVVCINSNGSLGHWCVSCYANYTWVCGHCFDVLGVDVYPCPNCRKEEP